jgi:hypothetical protein
MRSRLLVLLYLCLPVGVSAHHSHAEFSSETIELEGVLESIVWRNPHPAMTLRVPTGEGPSEVWRIQIQGNVNGLLRDGVNAEQFKTGETLLIAGHLSTRRAAILLATRARHPDGSETILGPDESSGAAIYTRGTARVGSGDGGESEGLFRVWTVSNRVRTQDLPLRDEARAQKAAWDPVLDDPPIEIRESGDTLLIVLEEWGAIRTIYMNASPGEVPTTRSLLGYSTGYWEGDTLVVTTSQIDYPYMDEHGTPQSSAAGVVERFSPSADGNSLDWSATVTDPGVFTEPVIAFTTRWEWIPGEEIQAYDCQELDPL